MSVAKQQHCRSTAARRWGSFAHSRRFDGPLSCGEKDCARAERDELRAETEHAQEQAREDDYARYR